MLVSFIPYRLGGTSNCIRLVSTRYGHMMCGINLLCLQMCGFSAELWPEWLSVNLHVHVHACSVHVHL